jgi:hypothetical protein
MRTREQVLHLSGLLLFGLPLLLYTFSFANLGEVSAKKATAISCSPANNKEESPVKEKSAPGCAHAGITALLYGVTGLKQRKDCECSE